MYFQRKFGILQIFFFQKCLVFGLGCQNFEKSNKINFKERTILNKKNGVSKNLTNNCKSHKVLTKH